MQRLQENMNNIQSWIQLRFFFTEMQRDMEPEKSPEGVGTPPPVINA